MNKAVSNAIGAPQQSSTYRDVGFLRSLPLSIRRANVFKANPVRFYEELSRADEGGHGFRDVFLRCLAQITSFSTRRA